MQHRVPYAWCLKNACNHGESALVAFKADIPCSMSALIAHSKVQNLRSCPYVAKTLHYSGRPSRPDRDSNGAQPTAVKDFFRRHNWRVHKKKVVVAQLFCNPEGRKKKKQIASLCFSEKRESPTDNNASRPLEVLQIAVHSKKCNQMVQI